MAPSGAVGGVGDVPGPENHKKNTAEKSFKIFDRTYNFTWNKIVQNKPFINYSYKWNPIATKKKNLFNLI